MLTLFSCHLDVFFLSSLPMLLIVRDANEVIKSNAKLVAAAAVYEVSLCVGTDVMR